MFLAHHMRSLRSSKLNKAQLPYWTGRRTSSTTTVSLSKHKDPDLNSSNAVSSACRSRADSRAGLQAHTFTSTRQCMGSEMQANGRRSFDEFVTPRDSLQLPDASLSLPELCELLHKRIYIFLESTPPTQLLRDVQEQVRISLVVVKQALEKYSLDQLALSYNGGKDCLVLLILYLVGLHNHFRQQGSAITESSQHSHTYPESLASVYIQHQKSFFEVDEFVRFSSAQYHLSLASSALNMKEAFGEYLQSHKNVKGIFVGTRRTDPHGASLTNFDKTDHGWPDFMRIHPVIDWHYREIWAFIRHFEVPYCSLYDLGYTSLGGTEDTFPNPKLKKVNTTDKVEYRPAHELTDDDEERLGREARTV